VEFTPTVLDSDGGFAWVRWSVTVGDGTVGAYVAGYIELAERHLPPTQPAAYAQQIVIT
jgi:hypothetical protein